MYYFILAMVLMTVINLACTVVNMHIQSYFMNKLEGES